MSFLCLQTCHTSWKMSEGQFQGCTSACTLLKTSTVPLSTSSCSRSVNPSVVEDDAIACWRIVSRSVHLCCMQAAAFALAPACHKSARKCESLLGLMKLGRPYTSLPFPWQSHWQHNPHSSMLSRLAHGARYNESRQIWKTACICWR